MICVTIHSNNVLTVENDAFSNAVSDSVKHETIKFLFSDNWNDYQKTAVFAAEGIEPIWVSLDRENLMCITEDECYIPFEVLKGDKFTVSVFGVKNEQLATSTKAEIEVFQSGYTEGLEPQEPTQSVYSQMINIMKDTQQIARSVRDDADNGLFKGEKGDKGDSGVGESGATFTPSVSEEGILSWNNDRGLENPEAVNVRGLRGEKGDKGDPFTYADFTPEQLEALKVGGVGKTYGTKDGEIFNDYHGNKASGNCSHAEGYNTSAAGAYSHTSGYYTEAEYGNQFVCGLFNDNKSGTIFEVGNGNNPIDKSNAFEVYRDGHAEVKTMGTTENSVVTKQYVDNIAISGGSGGVDLSAYATKEYVDGLPAVKNVVEEATDSVFIYSGDKRSYINVNVQGIIIDAFDRVIDVKNGQIVNLSEPTQASEAATKGYVDGIVGDLEALLGGI